MQIYQHTAEIPKLIEIDGSVIYKCPGLTIGTNLTAQYEFLFTVQFFFCEKLLHFFQMMNTKGGFNHCFPVTMLKNRSIGPLSKHKGKSAGNDGFTRSGFSRDHLQAFRKFDFNLFNDCIVLYM